MNRTGKSLQEVIEERNRRIQRISIKDGPEI